MGYLVLTLTAHEEIVLNTSEGDVVIRIQDARPSGGGYRASVGIDAPRSIVITRREKGTE
jgi:sRNA-binding carbon storage regulator CsrA